MKNKNSNKAVQRTLNDEEIIKKQKRKVLTIALVFVFVVLTILSVGIYLYTSNSEGEDDDRSTLDILLGREKKEPDDGVIDKNSEIKPVLDENGNVIKTKEEVAYEYNKFNQEKNNFGENPNNPEKNKNDANKSDAVLVLDNVKHLMQNYKLESAEKAISDFFLKNKRTSDNEETQKVLDELTTMQLDLVLVLQIGINYDDHEKYYPKTELLNIEDKANDTYVNIMKGLKHPLVYVYAFMELPLEFQERNVFDTHNTPYLLTEMSDPIEFKKIEEISYEDLGRDRFYFSNGIKTAWKMEYIYDATPLVATIVMTNEDYLQLVSIHTTTDINQFYSIYDWTLMDYNLKHGKAMFDGIDTSKITKEQTPSDKEVPNHEIDYSNVGGGI